MDSSVLKGKCIKRTPSGGSVGRRGVYGAKPPAGSWGITLVGGREPPEQSAVYRHNARTSVSARMSSLECTLRSVNRFSIRVRTNSLQS